MLRVNAYRRSTAVNPKERLKTRGKIHQKTIDTSLHFVSKPGKKPVHVNKPRAFSGL